MTTTTTKRQIEQIITNGYAETHVGYHAAYQYRDETGEFERGCYAHIAQPYGGTRRVYASSYTELLELVEDLDS